MELHGWSGSLELFTFVTWSPSLVTIMCLFSYHKSRAEQLSETAGTTKLKWVIQWVIVFEENQQIWMVYRNPGKVAGSLQRWAVHPHATHLLWEPTYLAILQVWVQRHCCDPSASCMYEVPRIWNKIMLENKLDHLWFNKQTSLSCSLHSN